MCACQRWSLWQLSHKGLCCYRLRKAFWTSIDCQWMEAKLFTLRGKNHHQESIWGYLHAWLPLIGSGSVWNCGQGWSKSVEAWKNRFKMGLQRVQRKEELEIMAMIQNFNHVLSVNIILNESTHRVYRWRKHPSQPSQIINWSENHSHPSSPQFSISSFI